MRRCRNAKTCSSTSMPPRTTAARPGRARWHGTRPSPALKEIGYDGWIVIEAFGDALPDLAAATKIWRRMFESEEQLARDGAAFIRDRWSSVAA